MPASLLDTNIWLASLFVDHPHHRLAQAILNTATSAEPAVFCRSTQQSFLRLATTPAVLKTYGAGALSNRDALTAMAAWLALPQIAQWEEAPGVAVLWQRLAARDTASPKVWMDAYLAAFAITGGLRFVSLDQDFKSYRAHRLDLQLLGA